MLNVFSKQEVDGIARAPCRLTGCITCSGLLCLQTHQETCGCNGAVQQQRLHAIQSVNSAHQPWLQLQQSSEAYWVVVSSLGADAPHPC